MTDPDQRNPQGGILEEIRTAYRRLGITLDQPAAYGTYYRLLCAGCGRMLGNVGDRLLPGMADALVDQQLDLYAADLLGCPCGHQRTHARALDPARFGPAEGPQGRRDDGGPR